MKKRTSNVKALLFITFVLMVLIGVIGTRITNLSRYHQELASELESVEKEIQDERERYIELLQEKEYVNSREYIEKLAREKFGLVKPGEIIFIPKEE